MASEAIKPEDAFGFSRTTLMVFAAFIGYLLVQVAYNIWFHPLAKIPGPLAWSASRFPYIRALLRGTIVHDFEKLHRKHGPILRVAPNEVTFAHAEAWTDILQPCYDPTTNTRRPEFLKDALWWAPQPGMGHSVLTVIDLAEHARLRKALAPALSAKAVRAQEPFLHQHVNLLVERIRESALAATSDWKGAKEVDICSWLHFTTFDMFGDLAFNETFFCLENSRYHPWVEAVFKSVKAVAYVVSARYFPGVNEALTKCTPAWLKEMQVEHYRQIADKVRRRMSNKVERPDIMSPFIQAEKEGKSIMSQAEIYATFTDLTTAGSDTTATTLSGVMNCLVQDPEALRILTAAIRNRFKDESEITLDALREDVPYLNWCLNEGLRLCPPVPWIIPRVTPPQGAMVCGVWIPGNTTVSIQQYAMGRDPRSWVDAEAFMPTRWDPNNKAVGDHHALSQPFSVGPSSCLGQHLAWAEMRLILAKLVWNFDFKAAEDPRNRFSWDQLKVFLLVEKKPIWVRVRARRH